VGVKYPTGQSDQNNEGTSLSLTCHSDAFLLRGGDQGDQIFVKGRQ